MGAMGHLEVMGTMGTRQGHLQRAVVTKHRHRKTETTRPKVAPNPTKNVQGTTENTTDVRRATKKPYESLKNHQKNPTRVQRTTKKTPTDCQKGGKTNKQTNKKSLKNRQKSQWIPKKKTNPKFLKNHQKTQQMSKDPPKNSTVLWITIKSPNKSVKNHQKSQ